MIGKVSGTGKGFRGLLAYLMRGRKDDPDPERVAWAETRNVLFSDPERAMRIMRRTANMSARCEKPVYHFSISWREDEVVTDEAQRRVADRVLQTLGLDEHQAILIGHKDTAHRHVHFLINRVHPDKLTAWRTSNDFSRLERAVGELALENGMVYVPGRFNEPDRFRREAKLARDSERQRARRLGIEANLTRRWTPEQIKSRRDVIITEVLEATTWSDLSRRLYEHGLAFAAKGRGVVIGDHSGTMKLSDLRKDIRLGELEQRLGTLSDYTKALSLEPITVSASTEKPIDVQPQKPDLAPAAAQASKRHRTDIDIYMRWDEATIEARRAHLRGVVISARSWDDIARKLAPHGWTLASRGGGLVIGDTSGCMKLSELGPDIRLPKLEDAFGEPYKTWFSRQLPDDDTSTSNAAPAGKALDTKVWSEEDRTQHGAIIRATFEKARSWRDIDRALSTRGLRVQSKGSGLVIDNGQATLKLSELGDDMRLARFEEKFQERLKEFEQRRAEEERLERMSREERMAALERKRQDPSATASEEDANTTDEQTKRPEPEARPQIEQPDRSASSAYHAASAAAELAYRLYNAGMVSRGDLKQALQDRDAAKSAWLETLSPQERLAIELKEALKAQKKEPSKTKKAPARIKPKKRKRELDREM